ncbi:hypothetical protein GCM10023188_19400 [Pontibacter saemangeumensis]|uniref:SGNH hydrolase-type esterase domain-containing protein n=1 Tax=Pontibacter saemangeumensis TaxID=1084525 RepID=A0ABP8LM35_9BACT
MLLLALLTASLAQAQDKPPFPEGTKRVLFLGNSITYAGRYISDLEAYFITRYPGRQYAFINLGLPSETVSGLSEPGHAEGRFPRPDLHERLGRVLGRVKPDVVFACYGMNDGIYLPFDEGRFAAFRSGVRRLHAALEKSGAKRIILLTPPVHDDAALGKYSQWLLGQRDSLGWEVADIHTPMTRRLETGRLAQPGFRLAADGVHPGEEGHWLMARAVLLYLGEEAARAPDALSALGSHPRGAEIHQLVSQRQAFMKDAWLRETGFRRPGMAPGIPLSEAERRYGEIEARIRAAVKGTAP